MSICMLVNDPKPLLCQLADEPVRLDRVLEPGFHPPLFKAASYHRFVDLLSVWIKNRQLAPWLKSSKPKIFELGRGRGF